MISMHAIFHFRLSIHFRCGKCKHVEIIWGMGIVRSVLVIQKGGVPSVLLRFVYYFSRDGCNQSSSRIRFEKKIVSLASKLLFKYTIHGTTETVLPNLSKYSHILKDGINIIYGKPFTSDYMECLPAPLI